MGQGGRGPGPGWIPPWLRVQALEETPVLTCAAHWQRAVTAPPLPSVSIRCKQLTEHTTVHNWTPCAQEVTGSDHAPAESRPEHSLEVSFYQPPHSGSSPLSAESPLLAPLKPGVSFLSTVLLPLVVASSVIPRCNDGKALRHPFLGALEWKGDPEF